MSANESYLYWLDVASGEKHTLTPRNARKEDPTVSYQGGLWSKDGKSVYTTSDKDSEFLRLVRLDAATGAPTVISGDVPWDVEDFALSDDGRLLAYLVNEDGRSRLHLIDTTSVDTTTGKALPTPDLPAGTAGALQFRPGSHEIGFDISWARSSSDVYSYDPAKPQHLERWTASEVGGLDPETFALPTLVRYPTFDTLGGDAKGTTRTIPAWVYRPSADRYPGKRPVVINIHGGPEGQARPSFLGSNNYILNELGVAVIVPNVRGSSGYGKTYLKLDNGKLREDSVKDIGALLDWIATQPDLDASRVVVTGGSYGGYMVLAVLTHYSDRLRCASSPWASATSSPSSRTPRTTAATCAGSSTATSAIRTCEAFLESIAPAEPRGPASPSPCWSARARTIPACRTTSRTRSSPPCARTACRSGT